MSSRLKRTRVVAAILAIAGLIAVAIVLITQFVLAEASIKRPTAPPQVEALRSEWEAAIFLPSFAPDCLTYDPNGARIDLDPTARGGKVLVVGFVAKSEAACRDAENSDVVITQAPALQSLHGAVTTITEGRMQFARVAHTTENGQDAVTLQWHCRINTICRLSGTTGPVITEDVLARMANSFAVSRPAS